jgi:hypothetical protein
VHSASGFGLIFLFFISSSRILNFSTCLIAYLYFCSPICSTFSIESFRVFGRIYSLVVGMGGFYLDLDWEEKSREVTWEKCDLLWIDFLLP